MSKTPNTSSSSCPAMSSETNQNSPEDMSSTAGSWYVSTAVHWVPLPNRPLTDVTRSSTWTMGTWTTSWTAKHSEFKSVGSGERCLKNEAQRKKHCKSGRLTKPKAARHEVAQKSPASKNNLISTTARKRKKRWVWMCLLPRSRKTIFLPH